MNATLALIRRELLLVMRRKGEVLTALFFFVIVSSLFPLGIGPEPILLRKVAPGVLWVGALLASMLGLQRMFAPDHADGTLEQMVISPTPLTALVAGKIAAHWLVSGLPLVLMAPVIGLQFDLDTGALAVLIFTPPAQLGLSGDAMPPSRPLPPMRYRAASRARVASGS